MNKRDFSRQLSLNLIFKGLKYIMKIIKIIRQLLNVVIRKTT